MVSYAQYMKPKRKITKTTQKSARKAATTQKSAQKKLPWKAIVAGVVALIVLLFVVLVITAPDDETSDDPVKQERAFATGQRQTRTDADLLPTSEPSVSLEQDPELRVFLQNIGAQYLQNLQFTYVNGYGDGGDTDGEYEEFYYDDDEAEGFDYGVMTVRRGLGAEENLRTIAHEYLHHVWYAKLTPQIRETLTTHLNNMYANDDYMQEYAEHYRDSGGMIPTELFSFYCTESSDANFVAYVLDQCNRFINRSALVMLD